MKNITLLTVFALALISCSKFEHETLELPSCDLCEYAPSLEGSFRGYASGIAVPNYGDSMNVSLEQIFLGNSQYEDSTYIHYRATYNFDSSTDNFEKIIRLKNTDGEFVQTIYFGSGSFVSYVDSVKIYNSGFDGVGNNVYISGMLYRQ